MKYIIDKEYIWIPRNCRYSLDRNGKKHVIEYIENLKFPMSVYDWNEYGIYSYFDDEYDDLDKETCDRAYKDTLIGWENKDDVKMEEREMSWSRWPIWVAVFSDPKPLSKPKHLSAKDIWEEYWTREISQAESALDYAKRKYASYDSE